MPPASADDVDDNTSTRARVAEIPLSDEVLGDKGEVLILEPCFVLYLNELVLVPWTAPTGPRN